MSKFLKIILFTLLIITLINKSFWAINMDISPIKYEINWDPWNVITQTATIKNNNPIQANIHIWTNNFTSSNEPWVPRFLDTNDHSYPDTELASWIHLNQTDFVLNPGEEREISFTINIPSNATPWWHYWAIKFKNNNSNNNIATWNSVSLEVDYASLIILTVSWDVVSKWTIWTPTITIVNKNANGGSSNYIPPKKDDCLVDLTISKYDWKCIDLPNNDKTNKVDNKETPKKDNFEVKVEIPFKNDWNTHIKPKWEIKLIDEDWNIIKWIWKTPKVNSKWVVIWDEVVDYLPINDWDWNVLPNSQRNFDSIWKWFPYKSYDKDWNQIIKYWTPHEYYSKQNIQDWIVIMPWERKAEKTVKKKIKAEISIKYKEDNKKDIDYNSAKEFIVEYDEDYIWLNPYVIAPISLLLFLIFIWYIIAGKKKIRCKKCNKKISKDMKICPYCEEKQ